MTWLFILIVLVVLLVIYDAVRSGLVRKRIAAFEGQYEFDSNGYIKGKQGFLRMGSDTAVLMIHGFRGSPSVFEELADMLHREGITVQGMLLPGHGRSVSDLSNARWQNWTSSVESTCLKLKERHSRIFVIGFSLGGLLALNLAVRESLAGVVSISPFLRINPDASQGLSPQTRLKVARLFPFTRVVELHREANILDDTIRSGTAISPFYPVKTMSSMVEFANNIGSTLDSINCPVLIQLSPHDQVVDVESAKELFERLPSEDKHLSWYENSAHELLLDREKRAVCDEILAFVQSHSRA